MDGDGIDAKESHIRVHKNKFSRKVLYIAPYNWEFEVRPKTIAKAIRFAISIGWGTENKSDKIYIALINDSFVEFPEGIKFTFEL